MSARILIADDSQLVRESMARLLGGHADWKVCGEASDGAEAIRKTRQLKPDLIVLDFLMPGMNGIETARHIARIAPEVPILLCTIFLSKELVSLAQEAGMMGTLSKADLVHIVPCIEGILSGESPLA